MSVIRVTLKELKSSLHGASKWDIWFVWLWLAGPFLFDRTHTCGYLAVGVWHRVHSAVLPGQSMALAVSVLGPVCQSVLACCVTGLSPLRKSSLFAWRSGCPDQISALRRRLYVLAGNQPRPAEYDVCGNGNGHSHHGSGSGCRNWAVRDFIVPRLTWRGYLVPMATSSPVIFLARQ